MSEGTAEGATPRGERRTTGHSSLPEEVTYALRRKILNHEFAPGERLIETKIAEDLGVSRTTLRSALRALANENLVEVTQRHGCFVAHMSRRDVHDSLYARSLLEVGAVCEDLSWITDEVLDRLEAEIHAMRDAALAEDLAAIAESDTEFHGIILAAAGQTRITELWHFLDGQIGSVIRTALDRSGIDISEIVERHQVLIAALRSRDADTIQRAIMAHYLERDVDFQS